MPKSQTGGLPLAGKIAVVTGASRGVGKGVALALGEAGATVYITGRTMKSGDQTVPVEGSLTATAREVSRLGGKGIPCRCDHRKDDQVKAVFKRIEDEQGHIDILVNNVWSGYENAHRDVYYSGPFWEHPIEQWDATHDVGLRSHYVASTYAAPLMIHTGSGLIVNISNYSSQEGPGDVYYLVSKLATDKLAIEMAVTFKEYGVACVSLWPGYVRTEGVMKYIFKEKLPFTESPQYTGRAIRALAADPEILNKTGQILIVGELAKEYGFVDIDGSRPKPFHQTELGRGSHTARSTAIRRAMSMDLSNGS